MIPINFNLRSDLEKESILNSYKIFLKTCDFDIQILVQSNKEDLSKHFLKIKEKTNNEENEIISISQEYIKYIENLNSKKNSSSKNYFILVKNSQIKIKENTDFEVKDIAKIENSLTNKQIDLAKWIAKRYFCTVSDSIKLMLTPGTKNKDKTIKEKTIKEVYIKKDAEEIKKELNENKIKSIKQQKVLRFILENGNSTIPNIEEKIDCSRAIVKTLIKNGYLYVGEMQIKRDPLKEKEIKQTDFLKLTDEKKAKIEPIIKKVEETLDIQCKIINTKDSYYME